MPQHRWAGQQGHPRPQGLPAVASGLSWLSRPETLPSATALAGCGLGVTFALYFIRCIQISYNRNVLPFQLKYLCIYIAGLTVPGNPPGMVAGALIRKPADSWLDGRTPQALMLPSALQRLYRQMQAPRALGHVMCRDPGRLLEGPGCRPMNIHSVWPQTLLGVAERQPRP